MQILSKSASYLLEKGARYRFQLSGKQLEHAGAQIQKLTKNIENPVVKVGINGRGAEGSIYGVQVFAKGSKKPVAAAAGRIDYRETDPILQARGFVRKNTGEGDALRGNVTLNTNKRFDIEGMDEVSFPKKGAEITLKADSPWFKADIKENKDAVAEIGSLLGFLPQIQKGRANLASGLRRMREQAIKSLNTLDPSKAKSETAVKPMPKDFNKFTKVVDISRLKNAEKIASQKIHIQDKALMSDYIKSLYK